MAHVVCEKVEWLWFVLSRDDIPAAEALQPV